MTTQAENISGQGDVLLKDTGASVGRFPFQLRTYQRPGRTIWSMDLVVDLDFDTALPLFNQNARLVLRVPGGRVVDFQIKSIQQLPERIEVVPSGGLREGVI